MREQMQEFQREGWAVAAISKALPRPDGTIHRQYQISRPKPLSSPAPSQPEGTNKNRP
jgi:hypothetical protein